MHIIPNSDAAANGSVAVTISENGEVKVGDPVEGVEKAIPHGHYQVYHTKDGPVVKYAQPHGYVTVAGHDKPLPAMKIEHLVPGTHAYKKSTGQEYEVTAHPEHLESSGALGGKPGVKVQYKGLTANGVITHETRTKKSHYYPYGYLMPVHPKHFEAEHAEAPPVEVPAAPEPAPSLPAPAPPVEVPAPASPHVKIGDNGQTYLTIGLKEAKDAVDLHFTNAEIGAAAQAVGKYQAGVSFSGKISTIKLLRDSDEKFAAWKATVPATQQAFVDKLKALREEWKATGKIEPPPPKAEIPAPAADPEQEKADLKAALEAAGWKGRGFTASEPLTFAGYALFAPGQAHKTYNLYAPGDLDIQQFATAAEAKAHIDAHAIGSNPVAAPLKDPKQAVLEAFEEAGKDGLFNTSVASAAGLPFDVSGPVFSDLANEGVIVAFHDEVSGGTKWHLAQYSQPSAPEVPAAPVLSTDANAVLVLLQGPEAAVYGNAASLDYLAHVAFPGMGEDALEAAINELKAAGLAKDHTFPNTGLPGIQINAPPVGVLAVSAPLESIAVEPEPAASTLDDQIEKYKQAILAEATTEKQGFWQMSSYPVGDYDGKKLWLKAKNQLVADGLLYDYKHGGAVKLTAAGKKAQASGGTAAGGKKAKPGKAPYAGEPVSSNAKVALGKAVADVLAQASAPLTVAEIGAQINLDGKGLGQYIWYGEKKKIALALNSLMGSGQVEMVPGTYPAAYQAKPGAAPAVAQVIAQQAATDSAAKKVLAGTPAAPVTVADVESLLADEAPLDLSQMTFAGDKPAGSMLGAWYTDNATGKKYLVKWGYGAPGYPGTYWGADPDGSHAKNEVLASKLAQAGGLPAVKVRLVTLTGIPGHPELDGKLAVASEYVPITHVDPAAKVASDPAWKAAAYGHYALNAWLSNWDVVGTGNGVEKNLVTGPDGGPLCIDLGGALEYHAQGKPKAGNFGNDVAEWDNFLNPGVAAQAASVFGGISPQEKINSAVHVMNIQDDAIRALVEKWGQGGAAQRKALADKLIARKYDIIQKSKDLANAAVKDKELDAKFFTSLPAIPADWDEIAKATPPIGAAQQAHAQAQAGYHTKFGFFFNHGLIDPDKTAAAAKTRTLFAQLTGINPATYDFNQSGKHQGASLYSLGKTKQVAINKWAGSPHDEQQALLKYTGGAYKGQNKGLRMGKPDAQAKAASRGFQKVMENLTPGTYVERGLQLDSSVVQSLKNNVGAVIQESGFSSSSPTDPWSWLGTTLCIYAAPGAKAANVHGFSQSGQGEGELLYGPNQRFLVLGVGHGKSLNGHDGNLIHLMALPATPDLLP